jgi:hypothetical protein
MPLADFLSLGHTVFMDTLDVWEPKKGSFSTLLTIKLRTGFIDYTRKFDVPVEQTAPDQLDERSPFDICSFKDMLSSMSEEAKEIVNIILDAPAETLDIIGTEPPKMIRGAIQRYLHYELGWHWRKIWRAFRELKGAINARELRNTRYVRTADVEDKYRHARC